MDYTIEKIIERLSEPEKLIDPQEINILQGYLNGHITDQEELEWQKQLIASNKLAELNVELSASKAEVQWKISQEYQDFKKVERTVRKLKRYRADLRDRFNLLTNNRYGH